MIRNIGNFKDYNDGTVKCVYDVGGNKIIEMSMLYNRDDRDVICVPTHHFCNLGCKMCHLTNKGCNKKMEPIKIDDFMYCISETLKKFKREKDVLLISFMGVGEPLLNINLIENVYKNEKILKDNFLYKNIGYSVSTMMPNKNIVKLEKIVLNNSIPLKVHFSLHTPIDCDRYNLIPSTKVSVCEALDFLFNYRRMFQSNDNLMDKYKKIHNNFDPTEIHYTLISGVNDSKRELDRISGLLLEYKIPIKFIRFNPINELKRSNQEEIWINTIRKAIPDEKIKVYSPPGREVGSSCGEFTKHYYHQEIETEEEKKLFDEWRRRHLISN